MLYGTGGKSLPRNRNMKNSEIWGTADKSLYTRVLCVHLNMGVCDLGDPLPPKQQCLVPKEDLGLVLSWCDLSAACFPTPVAQDTDG